ncbi:hypothetical protein AB835_02965 [Candidatus Endobugula sertula]|uniref:AsmA domain-containing protein n=1 Tax=Candidatus Endobugula sertula TaxID=62101 RepID=A0A1D2QSL1_9GAMM|nr:hypothetical protein AB835_02965 [Candidatus Endobugula sertula]
MKILKISLSILITLLLLLIVAIIALPQFIDPNDYKEQISRVVKDKTGLTLQIQGDLSLSVFPWLGLQTQKLSLAQPQDIASTGNFVEVDQANIKVKLKPLLKRELQVDTVLLKTPHIHIIVNKSGKSSIDSVITTAQGQQPTSTTNPTSNNAKTIAALTIAGINITDGNIIYEDQQTQTSYQLSNFNIISGNLLNDPSAPLHLSGKVTHNQAPLVDFNLDTQIHLNIDTLKAKAKKLALQVKHPLSTMNANIDSIYIDQQTQTIDAKNLQIETRFDGRIPARLTIPDISADLDKMLVTIPQLLVNSLGVNLSGDTTINLGNKMSMVRGHIQSNTFNPKEILNQLEIDYTPTKATALENLSIASSFNATPHGVSLQNTQIKFDQSLLESSISIINLENPHYQFDIALDKMIVDDYLPLTEETATTEENTKPTSVAETLAAPIALLKDIKANGVLRIKSLIANNIKLENSNLTIASDNKKVVLIPTTELYQGKLNGNITLKKTQNPELSIVTQLKGVQLEPLLIDTEVTDKFSGIGNVSTHLKVLENNGKPSTKGTINVVARDGAIKGLDLKKILDNGQKLIDQARGKAVTESSTSTDDKTQFAAMTATLLVNNDITTNNDLLITAPAARITGEGTINTAQQVLDYKTNIHVVNTNSGQGGKSLADLQGLTIPVDISGSFSDPKIKPDYSTIVKNITDLLLKEKKEKLKAELKAKEEELKDKATAKAAEKLGLDAEKEEVKQSLKDKLKKKLLDNLF